jgi:cobalt/nickel transport system permease protein
MRLELDEYAYLDSPIHRWHPQCKLIGLSVLIGAIASVEDIRLIPVVVALTVGLYWLSKLPVTYWFTRVQYPGFFLLGIVGLLPFVSGETVLWQSGILTIRQEGCLAVLLISCRFLAIITLSLLLFGPAPFLTMVKAMRSLGLPSVITDMMLLAYRYLYDMGANLGRMQQAMRLRGFQADQARAQFGGRSLPFVPAIGTLKILASLTGTLLVRRYEQSERVYKAMRLRGYGSQPVSTVPWMQTIDRGSAAALLGMIVLALGLVVTQRVWGINALY